MKINVIENDDNFYRTSTLLREAKNYLSDNPGSDILVVSPHIKISQIQHVVTGDDYFNSSITCIHPFDQSVRILKNGKVTQENIKEFFTKTTYNNDAIYTVFFDNPNLKNVEYIANKIKDELTINGFTITAKVGKLHFAVKALLPKNINLEYNYL